MQIAANPWKMNSILDHLKQIFVTLMELSSLHSVQPTWQAFNNLALKVTAVKKNTTLTDPKWSKLLETFCKGWRHKVDIGTENLIPHVNVVPSWPEKTKHLRYAISLMYATSLSRTPLLIDLTISHVNVSFTHWASTTPNWLIIEVCWSLYYCDSLVWTNHPLIRNDPSFSIAFQSADKIWIFLYFWIVLIY